MDFRKKRSKSTKINIGDQFGQLEVISFKGVVNDNMMIECKCSCGIIKIIARPSLRQGRTKSCGCLSNKLKGMRASGNSFRKLPGNLAAKNALLSSYKGGAKSRGYEWGISNEQFFKLVSLNCHYCDSEPSSIMKNRHIENANFIFNGIDRYDNNEGYTIENSVTCCAICNIMKNSLNGDEFIKHIKKIINFKG